MIQRALQPFIFMSEEYYSTVFEETVHHTVIKVKNETDREFYQAIKDIEGYESIINFDKEVEQFNNMIQALNYIIMVIIFTAGSLAFVVLINLTQVNISERIREIATLKVLGFRNNEVNAYIFKEIMILTVIGGLVGLPLGTVEQRFIMNVISMEMIMFGNKVKPLSYLYAYGITIIFTIVVLLLTRKPLRKIEMIESLKSVE